MQHRLEYFTMLLLVLIVRLLQWPTSLKWGNFLGDFIYKILGVRRKVALDNLRHAFPEKSEQELNEIAQRAYRNFVKMTIEYIRFSDLNAQKTLQIVEFDDLVLLDWLKKNGYLESEKTEF